MLLMDTGLFISNIGTVLTQLQWAGDAITDNTPPLQDRLLVAATARIPYDICAILFEIVNVSHLLEI